MLELLIARHSRSCAGHNYVLLDEITKIASNLMNCCTAQCQKEKIASISKFSTEENCVDSCLYLFFKVCN